MRVGGNLLRLPCTVVARDPGPPDRYGDTRLVDGATTDTLCYFEFTRQRAGAGEDTTRGQEASALATLVLDPAVPISETAAVDVTGLGRWEVVGEPRSLLDAFGHVNHLEVEVRQTR